MFTFGIFTTHLPYIAFVVFYAGLLIFGGEKTSVNDVGIGEGVVVKLPAFSDDNPTDTGDSLFSAGFSCYTEEKIIIHKHVELSPHPLSKHNTPLRNLNYRFPLFSRPPPVV